MVHASSSGEADTQSHEVAHHEGALRILDVASYGPSEEDPFPGNTGEATLGGDLVLPATDSERVSHEIDLEAFREVAADESASNLLSHNLEWMIRFPKDF